MFIVITASILLFLLIIAQKYATVHDKSPKSAQSRHLTLEN